MDVRNLDMINSNPAAIIGYVLSKNNNSLSISIKDLEEISVNKKIKFWIEPATDTLELRLTD